MSVNVICECGKAFAVPDELVGRRVKCRECGQSIAVAQSLGEIAPASPAGEVVDTAESSPFAAELARMNRVNRALMLVIGIFAVVSAGLSLAAFARSGRSATPVDRPPSEIVEAKRFIVRNPDGTLAAEFGFLADNPSQGYPGLRLFEAGKPRAEISIGVNHSAGLTLRDRNGQDRLYANVISSVDSGFENDESGFMLYAANGKQFASLTEREDKGGHFSLSDGREQNRIQLYVPAKDAPPHSVPTLTFFNAKGDDVLTIPSQLPGQTSKENQSEAKPKVVERPLLQAARLLASVDAGKSVDPTDPSIALMRGQLDKVNTMFGVDDVAIVNLVVDGRKQLDEAKTPTLCLHILQDLIEIKRVVGDGMDWPETYAFYLTARIEGHQNRMEAVQAVQSVHSALNPVKGEKRTSKPKK